MPHLANVVIGVDFSESSLAALRWTAHQFAPRARLVLVHAVDVPQPPAFLRGMVPPVKPVADSALEGARSRLTTLARELGEERVTFEARTGRSYEVLADAAGKAAADVVVVGEHGPRPGLWDVLGGTAENLLRTTRTPVLLVRAASARPVVDVLAAVDDSPLTDAVLRLALTVAEEHDARLTAFNVLSLSLRGHLRITSSEAKVETVERAFLDAARDWLRKAVERVGASERTGNFEVAIGDPPFEVVAAAKRFEADLIVMGGRGAGALERTLLGSVARAVLRGAPCPVLVVSEP
jgi:nucleotide-binding universal stress UspA family protein